MVRIVNESTGWLPRNPHKLVGRLLRKVPPEHLVGLGAVVIRDFIEAPSGARPLGLYREKCGRDPASILIAVGEMRRRWSRAFLLVPLLSTVMAAGVLYHELGHHFHQMTHGRKGPERSADAYKRRMIRQAFLPSVRLLTPFLPTMRLLARVLGEHKHPR